MCFTTTNSDVFDKLVLYFYCIVVKNFRKILTLMSQVVEPFTSAEKKAVKQRISEIIKTQKEDFARRVKVNEQYSKMMAEKILKEIKKEITEEKAKMNDSDAFYVKGEPEFFVAIQLRSQNNIAPRPKKTLQLLRLNQINNCVVVRNNLSMKNMLHNAKDYIAFGSISYELLRKLVYLRGYGKINGSKVKLTNENIETHFEGKFKCIEELCDVIYHGKPELKDVLRFLCPFKLNPPRGGFGGNKKRDFVQGGSSNDHKDLLGNLLERMI